MANLYDKPVNLDFINTYVSPDFNMLMKSGAAMQQRSDQAQLTEEQMQDKLLQVNALEYDKELRDQKVSEYEDAISKKLEEAGGSYMKIAPFIKEQRKKLHRDLTRGDLSTIQGNYTRFTKWYQENKEKAADGTINKGNFDLATGQVLRDYEEKRATGELENINLYNLVKANDYHADALKISGAMEGNKHTTFGDLIEGQGMSVNGLPPGHFERTRKTTDQLTSQEIYETVLYALKSDPKYKAELDQHAELTMKEYNHSIKEKGSNFLKERGELTPEEAEQMEAEGLNSNNFDDIEKWTYAKMEESVRNQVLRDASIVASNVDDYIKQEVSVTHFKDDAKIQGMLDKLALQGSAVGSGTESTLEGYDIENVQNMVDEDSKIIKEGEEMLLNNVTEYGIENLLNFAGNTGNPFLNENATDAERWEELDRMLQTDSGAGAIINRIRETNPNLSEAQIKNKVEDLKGDVNGYINLVAKNEDDRGIIANANQRALENINQSTWDNTYESYASAGGSLSKEEFVNKISTINSEEEIDELFPTQIGDENTFTGDRLLGAISSTAGAANPIISSTLGSIFNAAADYVVPGGNPIKTVQRLQDANYSVKEMWKKKQDEAVQIASDGYAERYTKLDLTSTKGVPASVSKENVSAINAIKDPKTNIEVNGMSTNILKAFEVGSVEELKNLDPKIIFDKGGPFYLISADIAGTSKTILAKVPGRAQSVHNTMAALVGSPDSTVDLGAKTYLGAESMGAYWKPTRIGLLNHGEEYTLRKSNGSELGSIRKDGNNFKFIGLDGQEKAWIGKDTDDIARLVYSAFYENS
jgi:hypothetical protein